MLTQERLKELLDFNPKSGIFIWVRPTSRRMKHGYTAGGLDGLGYIGIYINGTEYLAHRLAWLFTYGEWPARNIDHINRNRADNRIENLRLATRGENMQNTGLRSDNSSGCKGVCWYAQRKAWRAQLNVNHKTFFLGDFDNLLDAAAARKSAEINLHPYRAA